MPETVQATIFSATLPLEILEVTSKFMRDPVRILVKRDELTLQGIKQYYVAIEKEVRGWIWDGECFFCVHVVRDRVCVLYICIYIC